MYMDQAMTLQSVTIINPDTTQVRILVNYRVYPWSHCRNNIEDR
jgi:hypothetical protein